MLVRPSWMWNDTVEQRWQCCSALAYFWLVGLSCPIHCRGFLWFIFRKCKHGKLSAWLALLTMSKIFSSLDMTTVFLPSVWRMATRLRSSIIPLTHIQGNPGAVCWNSCWVFFFWRKPEKKKRKIPGQNWATVCDTWATGAQTDCLHRCRNQTFDKQVGAALGNFE